MVTTATLDFAPLTNSDVARLSSMLGRAASRSCDFTVGGIFMWVHYFGYECAVRDNTLFIRGLSEDPSRRPAFSLPVGDMPLPQAVGIVKDYCADTGAELLFSAIPEDRLADLIAAIGEPCRVEELPDWADYLYRATDLAQLPGKAYNKKRNHVHRFVADNPDWRLDDITPDNIASVITFASGLEPEGKADPVMAEYEREACLDVLRNFADYGFEGAVLRGAGGRIVAFTAGEVVGDTLVLHIEKMDHNTSGAGETINHLFAARMLERHPELRYINREDDSGDPGLRFAKESYHPAMRLRKFNVSLL